MEFEVQIGPTLVKGVLDEAPSFYCSSKLIEDQHFRESLC